METGLGVNAGDTGSYLEGYGILAANKASAPTATDAPESAAAAVSDTVTFSPEAQAASAPFSAESSFSGSAVKSELGDGTTIQYANGGGIVWNGKTLNLKGLTGIDAKTDDLAFQASGSYINVYNTATNTGYQLNLDGSQAKNADGTLKTVTGTFNSGQSVLVIKNTSGSTVNGGNAGDVVINRAAGAEINTGGGDDKVFNFASNAKITGGSGNVEVYTVGLTGGSIDLSASTNAKITVAKGNMSGGDIKLSGGNNIVDASRVSFTGTNIADASTATTTFTTKDMTAGKLELKGAATVTVNTLSTKGTVTFGNGANTLKAKTISSSIAFGTGNNVLTADTVKGATIVNGGKATYTVRSFDGSTVNSSAATADVTINITSSAKNSTFHLGKGVNSLNAAGKTLTSVTITDGADTAKTTIKAAALTGTASARSSVSLHGKEGTGTNILELTGAITQASIDLGAGVGILKAKSVTDSTIRMDTASAVGSAQTIGISGNVVNSSITTGLGNDKVTITGNVSKNSKIDLGGGADTANISGSLADSVVDLGDGDNTLTVAKTVKGLTYKGGAGKDDVRIKGAVSNSSIDLGAGSNSFIARNDKNAAQNLTNVKIIASGAAGTTNTVIGAAYKAGANKSIELGNGTNTLSFSGAVTGLNYTGSTGIDLITIGGAVTSSAFDAKDGNNTLTVGKTANGLTYKGGADKDDVRIKGTVTNASADLGAGSNSFIARNDKNAAQNLTNVKIIASGVAGTTNTVIGAAYKAGANNSITLGNGTNTLSLSGAVTGLNYTGSTGIDLITIGGAVTSSTFDAKDGDNTLTIAKTAKGLTYQGGAGKDDVTVKGSVTNGSINLGGGSNSFIARTDKGVGQALTSVQVTAAGASSADINTIIGGAYKAGAYKTINLGNGSNNVSLSGAVAGLAYAGSTGIDVVTIGGAVTSSTFDAKDGDNKLSIGKTAASLTYQGGAGKDDVTVKGSVTNGSISLGGGSNSFIAMTDKNVGQTLTNVQISASGASSAHTNTVIGGAYKAGAYKTINLGNGTNDVSLAGAVTGLTYTGSTGIDVVTIGGAVANTNVDLKSGDNDFIAAKYDKKGKATGQALSNVNITATGAGSTNILAGAVTTGAAGNKITLGSGDNVVDLGAVNVSKKFTIDGSTAASNEVYLRGAVKNTDYLGAAGDDTVVINGAVSTSTFKLGDGQNEFSAVQAVQPGKLPSSHWGGQALNNVLITAEGTSTTSVTGGAMNVTAQGYGIKLGSGDNNIHLLSLIGTKTAAATIEHAAGGSGSYRDMVIVGELRNAKITAADGSNALGARWANDATISLGAGTTESQNIDIMGTVYNSSIKTGNGDDYVSFNYTAKNSTIDLGDGYNIFNAFKGGDGVTYKGGAGTDYVFLQGPLSNSNINLGGGDNIFQGRWDPRGKMISQNLTNVNITATGNGTNKVDGGIFKAGAGGNTIDLGSGDNTVTFTGVNSSLKSMLTVKNVSNLNILGKTTGLDYIGTAGDDNVVINDTVTDSNFRMGTGNDAFMAIETDNKGMIIGQALNNVNIYNAGGKNVLAHGKVKYGPKGNTIEGEGINVSI